MVEIKNMEQQHAEEVKEMMRVFYASPAVLTNGSEEIFYNDIEQCISDNPYLEGYVFIEREKILGYAMLAKSFSTEYGKPCIWIEDIYLKPEYCGMGIGTKFFDFIDKKYQGYIFRLEVEEDNERAVHVYQKAGFTVLPYLEMKKE